MYVKNYFPPELAHVDEKMVLDLSQEIKNQKYFYYDCICMSTAGSVKQNAILHVNIPYFWTFFIAVFIISIVMLSIFEV